MHVYLRNNSATFRPDPIWNDGALGFYEEVAPTTRGLRDVGSVPDPKNDADIDMILITLLALLLW